MKRKILTIGALFAALSTFGVPAKRKPFVFRQPDGTALTVTLIGDEYSHYYLTADGQRLTEGEGGWLLPFDTDLQQARQQSLVQARRRAQQTAHQAQLSAHQAQRATANMGRYPTLGSPRQLVLLVEYPDCRFRYDGETFRRMLCEEGFRDDGATGSAYDYFRYQSGGLFTPDFEVVGPVMLPHPRAYYGTPTANMYDAQPWLMLTDAAPLVDAEVDFSHFDNDGDGFVDNVFVFYAGEGQNDGGPLEAVWPHAANVWTYYGLNCTLDGVQLGSYACTNEVTAAGRMTGIGTFCHEYSHVLGLPDIYSTQDASACFSPGAYELMDSGSYNNEGRTPPNMSAYDREMLGWVMPEALTAPETVVLPPRQFLLSEGGSNGAEGGPNGAESGYSTVRRITTVKPEEYYLLENRQQTGWDAYLPGHGMLIWHIDYDARAWENNQVNVLPGHQRVDLVEADGILTKETQDGDPFPGARQTTAVNLLPWTGVPIDAAITEIREAQEGTITFKFRGGGERIAAPVALEAAAIGPCGFTAQWTGVPAVTDYEVMVWRGQEAVALDVTSEAPRMDAATGYWTTSISGLAPETSYRYAVVAIDGERRSPLSNEVRVTTAPPTFDMLAPTDLAAEICSRETGTTGESGTTENSGNTGETGETGNTGSAGAPAWLLTWTPLDEAVCYEVEVYAHRVVAPDVATLDFTGGITALPAGWTTTSTQTSGVAGTFGAARPSLMLQPGEWLQSPVFAEAIVAYDFWQQGTLTAMLQAGGRQLRVTNASDALAYLDDIVVSYGGAVEQVDVETFSTADKASAAATAARTSTAGDPGKAQLVVPLRDGELWCRVRGVRSDGLRSAWSAELALPLVTGLSTLKADDYPNQTNGRQSKAGSYSIPPFVVITADGRKSIKLEK